MVALQLPHVAKLVAAAPVTPWAIGAPQARSHGRRSPVAAAARRVGVRLEEARDEDDLAELLDVLVDEDDLVDAAILVTAQVQHGRVAQLGDANAMLRRLVAAGGREVLPDMFAGIRLAVVIEQTMLRGERDRPAREGEVPMLDLRSSAVPLPVVRGWLAAYRAFIAFAGLADVALHRSSSVAPRWLVRRLAHVWRVEQRPFLAVAAMFFGDDEVSDDVLPRAERLTWAEVEAQHRRHLAKLDSMIGAARAGD